MFYLKALLLSYQNIAFFTGNHSFFVWTSLPSLYLSVSRMVIKKSGPEDVLECCCSRVLLPGLFLLKKGM